MIQVKGVDHLTITDAADRLGVSAKTVNVYISRGILPRPTRVKQGLRTFFAFSEEYLTKAEAALEAYRAGDR